MFEMDKQTKSIGSLKTNIKRFFHIKYLSILIVGVPIIIIFNVLSQYILEVYLFRFIFYIFLIGAIFLIFWNSSQKFSKIDRSFDFHSNRNIFWVWDYKPIFFCKLISGLTSPFGLPR